jgi:ABC-2 type transport system permease protein
MTGAKMTSLLSVEVRRLLARRIVHLAAVLALAAILIGGITAFARSHRLGPEGLRAEQERATAERQEEIDACARGEFGVPEDEIPPGMTLQEFCEQFVVGEVPGIDPRFHLTAVKDVLAVTSGFLIAILLVIGASYVGAEWHAGSMATFLTWEPRRVRVFVAKVVAIAAFAFVALLIVQLVLALALVPAATLRGTTEGADSTWFASTVGLQLRAALMASVAAAIGLSVASIGRNTAIALGAGFVYFSIAEPFLRALRPQWQRWFLSDNVAMFIAGEGSFNVQGRSVVGAFVVVAAYALGMALVALELFRRRDVT